MKLASRIDNHDFAVFGEIPASDAKELRLTTCPVLPAQS
jgi:hypothetical protein